MHPYHWEFLNSSRHFPHSSQFSHPYSLCHISHAAKKASLGQTWLKCFSKLHIRVQSIKVSNCFCLKINCEKARRKESFFFQLVIPQKWGTRWRSWLRHYATSRKVAGLSPDEVVSFNLPNPSSRTMALGSTQPLTEMSTRNLPGGKERPAH
jgi:hypothetical protein